jgi:hypothetical protein
VFTIDLPHDRHLNAQNAVQGLKERVSVVSGSVEELEESMNSGLSQSCQQLARVARSLQE